MLCELVLAGVGGRTLAEAAEALTEDEFNTWALYRRLRGSFNLGMRAEWEGAKLRALLVRVNGGKSSSVEDFMVHTKDTTEDAVEVPNFKQAMTILGFTQKG